MMPEQKLGAFLLIAVAVWIAVAWLIWKVKERRAMRSSCQCASHLWWRSAVQTEAFKTLARPR